MSEGERIEQTKPRPAQHILPTSGTMLGVTTTLIGLVKLIETQTTATRVDEFAGIVGFMFLLSAVTSYASIRVERRDTLSRRLEWMADISFLVGLVSLAGLAALFAWELV